MRSAEAIQCSGADGRARLGPAWPRPGTARHGNCCAWQHCAGHSGCDPSATIAEGYAALRSSASGAAADGCAAVLYSDGNAMQNPSPSAHCAALRHRTTASGLPADGRERGTRVLTAGRGAAGREGPNRTLRMRPCASRSAALACACLLGRRRQRAAAEPTHGRSRAQLRAFGTARAARVEPPARLHADRHAPHIPAHDARIVSCM